MSNFERIYQIEPDRESIVPREKNIVIEKSDREYMEGLQAAKISKEMEDAGFIYKPPVDEESMSPALKEKFKKARELTKDTKVIDLRKKNERKKSKAPTKRTKKVNPKSDSTAVADVQK